MSSPARPAVRLPDTAAALRGLLDDPERDLPVPGGPWNLSQTLQHCAQTVRCSVTGYPRLRPVLFRLTAGALAKRVFLRRGAMRHPLDAEIAGAPPLDPHLPTEAALTELEEAIALFTAHTGEHAPHPAYGRCTHEEYERLHALHLAEHLPGAARA
ncbi:DUF1569 domain-containing protein [Streptomyces sp. NPDC090106]|uniref:DUF1569 domain-containing protein n=1 Tax=Streptomyces sp. NPDC090106 TaxID=3365946 RepID=UPI00380F8C91